MGLGRSPGEGHGNLLQYSYLKNPMDRGAWWATVDHKQSTEPAYTNKEKIVCGNVYKIQK